MFALFTFSTASAFGAGDTFVFEDGGGGEITANQGLLGFLGLFAEVFFGDGVFGLCGGVDLLGFAEAPAADAEVEDCAVLDVWEEGARGGAC